LAQAPTAILPCRVGCLPLRDGVAVLSGVMIPGMIRQAGPGPSPPEERQSQIYTLLTTQGTPRAQDPSAWSEIGVLSLVPVVIWCLASWALSYAGSTHLLAKIQLFAFLPAAASAFACERIRQLRSLPAQLSCLKEENEWFKGSNEELKKGIDLLRTENEETRTANQRLQSSIEGLESVRSAIETYASRHETDFGQVLADFQKSVSEQQQIQRRTLEIQRRTRRLTEAQWRALMLNLYTQVEKHDKEQGLNRKKFGMWLSMLPIQSEKLTVKTFDTIDSNRDGIIDTKEMCAWVPGAVKTLLGVSEDESSEDEGAEAAEADGYMPTFTGLFSSRGQQSSGSAQRGSSGGSGISGRFQSSKQAMASAPSAASENSSPDWKSVGTPTAGSKQRPGSKPPPPSRTQMQSSGGEETARSARQLAAGAVAGSANRRSERELTVPRRASGSRPSFNDSYMQMLFGASTSTAATTPERNGGGASSPEKMSPSSRASLSPTCFRAGVADGGRR